MKTILGALLFSLSAQSLANAVLEFRRHVSEWDYQSTDQLGERCKVEIFGARDGGLRIDLVATGQLQFSLTPSTPYMSSPHLFVATTPAISDTGEALSRLIIRNKKTLTIEREFTNRSGRIYISGLTCDLEN